MVNEFFRARWQSLIRTIAFVGKEARTIFHQPRLVFSLILGPFLILLIFGLGYSEVPRTLDTLFVVPEGSPVESFVEQYAESLGGGINFVGITRSAEEADARLRRQEVDLVVVVPADPAADWAQDERARLAFYHYEIDPYEETYVHILGQTYVETVNEQILLQVAEQSQEEAAQWQEDVSTARSQTAQLQQALDSGNREEARELAGGLQQQMNLLTLALGSGLVAFNTLEQTAGDSTTGELVTVLNRLESIQQSTNAIVAATEGNSSLDETEQEVAEVEARLSELDVLLSEFRETDPRVIVSPFRSETLSITDVQLQPIHYYVPGAIALLMQHLAVTLAGMAIIREKLGGAMELFRAAPVTPLEMLSGKYTSFLLVIGAVAAILIGLIVLGLGVPQLGSWIGVALVVLALLLASLGIGFNISLSARSDSQAIQFAMLTLLASIFFTGFFLPLYRLSAPVRVISWALPATYGTVLLQDIMLRGQSPDLILLGALFIFAGILFLLAWWRLGRQMAME